MEGSAAWTLCPPSLWAWNQGPGESSAPDPPGPQKPLWRQKFMQSHQPASWELQIQRQTTLRPSLTQGHTIKYKTGSRTEHHGSS